MAGCFDFRMRASSFDMHQLAQRHKLAKISKLFRSRSDTNVKATTGGSPLVSPKDSPKGSPSQQPRRRFMRVVRDADKEGEEYENPHIIRRYTQEYVESKYTALQKSTSMEESKLPYTPQEDSILKKGMSLDCSNVSPAASLSGGEQSPSACNKHARFEEEVEIIEYDKKGKIQKCVCLTHKEKLHDDSDSDFLEESSEECEYHHANKENTHPASHNSDQDSIGDSAAAEASKSLKDSSLDDIVNSEKAVNRERGSEGSDSSDTENQQPIKKSKRHINHLNSDEGNSKATNGAKDNSDAMPTISKTVAALVTADIDDMIMASSITKVHIKPYLDDAEDDGDVFLSDDREAVPAREMVKAEL